MTLKVKVPCLQFLPENKGLGLSVPSRQSSISKTGKLCGNKMKVKVFVMG